MPLQVNEVILHRNKDGEWIAVTPQQPGLAGTGPWASDALEQFWQNVANFNAAPDKTPAWRKH